MNPLRRTIRRVCEVRVVTESALRADNGRLVCSDSQCLRRVKRVSRKDGVEREVAEVAVEDLGESGADEVVYQRLEQVEARSPPDVDGAVQKKLCKGKDVPESFALRPAEPARRHSPNEVLPFSRFVTWSSRLPLSMAWTRTEKGLPGLRFPRPIFRTVVT